MFYTSNAAATIADMVQRVGFWLRSAAFAVDLVLGALPALVIAAFLAWNADTAVESERIFSITFYALLLLYTLTEAFFGGTPGKLLLGLRVGRADGRRAEIWTRLLRWNTQTYPFLFFITGLLTGFPYCDLFGSAGLWFLFIGCFHAANDWKQAWHDEWAHTAIFRRRDLIPA